MTQVGTVLSLFRFPVKSMLGDNPDAIHVSESGFSGDRGWAVRDERRGDFATGKRVAAPDELSCDCGRLRTGLTACRKSSCLTVTGSPQMTRRPRSAFRRRSGEMSRSGRSVPIRLHLNPSKRSRIPAADFRSTMARAADEPMPDFSAIPPELLATFGNPERPYVDFAPLMLLSQQSLDSIASAAPDSEIDVRRFRPSVLVDTPSDEAFPEQAWVGKRVQIGEVVLDLRMTCPRCVMTTHGFADLEKDPTVMRTLVQQAEGNLGVYANRHPDRNDSRR